MRRCRCARTRVSMRRYPRVDAQERYLPTNGAASEHGGALPSRRAPGFVICARGGPSAAFAGGSAPVRLPRARVRVVTERGYRCRERAMAPNIPNASSKVHQVDGWQNPAGNTSQGKSSVSKWRTHRASHSADVAAVRPADVAAAHPADPAARRPTGYRRRTRRRRAHRISPLSASARGRRQQDPGPRQDRRDSFGRDGPDAQDPWPVVSAVDDR